MAQKSQNAKRVFILPWENPLKIIGKNRFSHLGEMARNPSVNPL